MKVTLFHTFNLLFLSTSLFLSNSCTKKEFLLFPSSSFDATRAYAEIKDLVTFSPRDAGTPNGKKAAEHILSRLKSFGVEAQIQSFIAQTPQGTKTMYNVIGSIKGKHDQWIILGSHFDTMPGIKNFQGANDSGSSTGILLEIARIYAHCNLKIGILFLFFDGEESTTNYQHNDGLYGSRFFAKQIQKKDQTKKIRAMILLDMVGDESLQLSIPISSSTSLVKKLFKAADHVGCQNYVSLASIDIIDDHVPFLKIGIPSIDLIDFHFGSKPNLNDYWHTESDNLEHLSIKSIEITGTITLELLRQLSY